MKPSPYGLGHADGYAVFLTTGLPAPPEGGWVKPLLDFLGSDGLLSYFGLSDEPVLSADATTRLLRAIGEYESGCWDGFVDAQKDRALS